MKLANGALRAVARVTLAAGVIVSGASAYADGGDDHGGFGRHPALPVPAALVFGGLAVSAAALIARRRRKSDDTESKSDRDDSKADE
jgi:hypothetical protein